ncbi:hypothetical protein [Georgenia faecalis]|uniref:hypothetical protein n=1 Tax=Georgenia faecalis TaxID=2483799 RepID=UPI000FDBAD0F|nr:hypothetical protein [Georgenia faecalis]
MALPARARRAAALGTAAILALGLLGGCTPAGGPGSTSRTEHSPSDAADAIADLPGISSAEVSTSTEGTANQVLLQARVAADAGYAADPADLLDYVVRQVWSTTGRRPTTAVRVDLTVEGQDLDLEALAGAIGLPGTVDTRNRYDASVHLRVEDLVEAYGRWPGDVPSPPPSLTDAVS